MAQHAAHWQSGDVHARTYWRDGVWAGIIAETGRGEFEVVLSDGAGRAANPGLHFLALRHAGVRLRRVRLLKSSCTYFMQVARAFAVPVAAQRDGPQVE
jgi:hypothetical protein